MVTLSERLMSAYEFGRKWAENKDSEVALCKEAAKEIERLRQILDHHSPLMCGFCGDAIHGTGRVENCGFSLCECGDDVVLTRETAEAAKEKE